jgi:seryl-tRNA(Sec) selenium transferase
VLATLARDREVIVSRGELVEIGGGFRVPDVLAQSGAVLREVGTTNRTRVGDYAAAISDRTRSCSACIAPTSESKASPNSRRSRISPRSAGASRCRS